MTQAFRDTFIYSVIIIAIVVTSFITLQMALTPPDTSTVPPFESLTTPNTQSELMPLFSDYPVQTTPPTAQMMFLQDDIAWGVGQEQY